jgi:hypothetical protein
VDYVKKSIEKFGYLNPIIVNEDNIIICGHTRYKALKKIGIEIVDVIEINDLTEKQEKAFRLADNKVAEFSSWDYKKLLKETSNMMKEYLEEFGLEPYSFEDLEEDEEKFIGTEDKEVKHIYCPFCGGEVK